MPPLKSRWINLPEGVVPTITDRDFVIATLAPPTVEVEEAKTEEETEGEGTTEGESKEEEKSGDKDKKEAPKKEVINEKK